MPRFDQVCTAKSTEYTRYIPRPFDSQGDMAKVAFNRGHGVVVNIPALGAGDRGFKESRYRFPINLGRGGYRLNPTVLRPACYLLQVEPLWPMCAEIFLSTFFPPPVLWVWVQYYQSTSCVNKSHLYAQASRAQCKSTRQEVGQRERRLAPTPQEATPNETTKQKTLRTNVCLFSYCVKTAIFSYPRTLYYLLKSGHSV